jgi:hypothetical protein
MTLTETITAQSNQRAGLVAENQSLQQQIGLQNTAYADWVAIGNYTEAHKHSDLVDSYNASFQGNLTLISSLNSSITSLQSQATALASQTQANANLTNANSKLTPEQLTALHLAEIKGQQDLAKLNAENASKAQSDTEANKLKLYAQKNTTYIIYGVIGVVLIFVGVLVWKKLF